MVDQDSILILTELPWYNFLKMAKDPLTLLPMTGGGLIPHPFIWAGLSDLLYQKNDILRLLRARHKTYFSPGLLACSLSCLQEASHHRKSLTILTLPCVEEANAHHVEGPMEGKREILSQAPDDQAISAQTTDMWLKVRHLGCSAQRSFQMTLGPAKHWKAQVRAIQLSTAIPQSHEKS